MTGTAGGRKFVPKTRSKGVARPKLRLPAQRRQLSTLISSRSDSTSSLVRLMWVRPLMLRQAGAAAGMLGPLTGAPPTHPSPPLLLHAGPLAVHQPLKLTGRQT